MAFVMLYLMTTYAAALLEAVSRRWIPHFRRIAVSLTDLVPGTGLWGWLDLNTSEPWVVFAGAIILALPVAYAAWHIQSTRAWFSRREAAIEDERVREHTRQQMRRDRPKDS